MIPMNRLSQQRDTSGQWEEIEEERPFSRYRQTCPDVPITASRLSTVTIIDQIFSLSG